MPSPAQNAATAKYIKTHMRRWVLQCNNEKDADIIEYLSAQPNVNALLKKAIRAQMEIEYMSNIKH